MVSFNVDSLFTNVPVDETLEFLQNHLSVNNQSLPFLDVLIKRSNNHPVNINNATTVKIMNNVRPRKLIE